MQTSFEAKTPKIDKTCFIAAGAQIIGEVALGAESSVWFNTVIRGDVNRIQIGCRTNIQDLTMVHVTGRDAPNPTETHIGDEVTIGHRVIIHGATIGDRSLIGMGAIILDSAMIEQDCVIGAGSLVTMGTIIPKGHLAFGSPAKVIRALTEVERAGLKMAAAHYVRVAQSYQRGRE